MFGTLKTFTHPGVGVIVPVRVAVHVMVRVGLPLVGSAVLVAVFVGVIVRVGVIV